MSAVTRPQHFPAAGVGASCGTSSHVVDGTSTIRHVLVVTSEGLPGYEIRSVLGEVLGVTAASRNKFAAGVRSPDGGPGPEMSRVLVQTRARAIGQMIHAAQTRGVNAVIAMRFDNRDITDYWMEVCAYGTAVLAIPVSDEAKRQDGAIRQTGGMPHQSP